MKKIIFLLALFMLFKPVLPVVDYVVNYEYISKVLCENKGKPKMHCNGKCHLMKELAKTSDAEKPMSPNKKNVVQEVEVLFLEKINTFMIANIYNADTLHINSYYSNLYSFLDSSSVFQPPTRIS